MAAEKTCLVTILIIYSSNYLVEGFALPGIGDIQTISNFANDAVAVLKGDLSITALLTGSTTPTLDKILDTVSGISEQLDEFGAKFTAKLDENAERVDRRFDEVNAMLDKILVQVPLAGQMNAMTRELHDYIVRVDALYEKYQRYSESRENLNNYTIENFIKAVTSDRRGDLDDVLTRINRLLNPGRSSSFTEGILNVLADQINKTGNTNCGTGISPQLRLYQVYEAIVVTETRGFIMSLFVYSLLSVFKRSSFENEMKHVKNQYLKRADEYLKITVQAMRGLPRDVILCDAPKYVSNIDYVELSTPYTNYPSVISLKPQVADVDNNMIVTGIRFTKSKVHMINVQIRQGYLLPQGLVDNRNESWKELPELVYTGGTYRDANNGHFYSSVDYVNTRSRKSFFVMTEVILPHGYVVGGIQLKQMPNPLYNRNLLVMFLYAIKFDFKTGKLDTKNAKWLSVYNTKDKQKFITANEAWRPSKLGNPTLATKNVIDSEEYEQYNFQSTNDDSHKIVPFFDARSVVTMNPSFALTGVGLYHRGAENYGGYFNYKLVNIDLTKYIKT